MIGFLNTQSPDARRERPRGHRAAEQREERTPFQWIELHSVPAAKPDCSISNWQGSVSGYSDMEGLVGIFAHLVLARSRLLKRVLTSPAFCKRGSVNVHFAPKATEALRCRELTRCANCCLTPPLRLIVLLFARNGCKSARCQRLSENPA